MKSKAPLTLMEQIVMLLVFALAAGLCLQMFVLTGQMSRRIQEKDAAVTEVQNVAETVKFCSGDLDRAAEELNGSLENGKMILGYDDQWMVFSADQANYRITTELQKTDGLMGKAIVSAQDDQGEEIFQVIVSWQEVAYE